LILVCSFVFPAHGLRRSTQTQTSPDSQSLDKVKLITANDFDDFVTALHLNRKKGYRLVHSVNFGGEFPQSTDYYPTQTVNSTTQPARAICALLSKGAATSSREIWRQPNSRALISPASGRT
jgi:hypothetical protein